MTASSIVSNCREGCPDQNHDTYAQCLRATGPRIAYTNSVNGWDYSKQKKWDRELARYRQLSATGVEPEGTTHRAMDRTEKAMDWATTQADAG